ncbi:MAG: hypothetical protein NC048_09860 [Bacteroides sp.]|nr:hypothetical protein [Bacteroides sp.]
MEAIDIVQYMIDNDLTRQELKIIAKKLIDYVDDADVIRELKERKYGCILAKQS